METGLFPRGTGPVGKDEKEAVDKKAGKKRKANDDRLFSDRKTDGNRREKGKRAKVVKKKREHGGGDTYQTGGLGKPITFAQLTEGVQMLGVVTTVRRNTIQVSLPFNLVGYLDSSETLLDAEKMNVDSLQDMPDEGEVGPKPLAGLLKERDVVGVTISSAGKSTDGRREIKLTMKLELLNRGLDWSHLSVNFPLLGAVKSIEEHGYVLSLGDHVNFTAFLPFTDGETENTVSPPRLHLGAPVRCYVNEEIPAGKRRRSVKVRADPVKVASVVTDIYDGMGLSNLRVGALVNTVVTKATENLGAIVTFMSLFTGRVDSVHFPIDKHVMAIGAKHRARVIYIDVSSKTVYLSMKGKLTKRFKAPVISGEYVVGATFEDAVVKQVIPNHGVVLKREDGVPLFAHISRVADVKVENLAKHFKVGQRKRCRVMTLALLDGVVNVSLQDSVLDCVAMKYEDLKPGQIINATVDELNSSGCVVSITKVLRGLIPPEHLADVKLVKRAKEKYKPGEMVKCMILSVNARRRECTLTAKRSLLKGSDLVLKSYEEAADRLGDFCVGYVIATTPAMGVIVGFCDGVRGYVPASEIGIIAVNTTSDLEAQFQQGQTVKSRIVSCDPEKRRVTLSLKTAPTSGNSLELLSKLSPGEIVSGVVTEATSDALQIRVADEENTASVQCLLPMEHLADTLDLAKRALKAYSPDLSGVPPPPLPKIEDLMILKAGNKISAPVLTMKPSLLAARRANALPMTLEQLRELQNEIVVGYIAALVPTGAVVGFGNGLTGFARKSRIADAFVPEPNERLHVGQTVYIFVESVDSETNKISLSLRHSDLAAKEAGAVQPSRVASFFNQLYAVQDREVQKKQPEDKPSIELLSETIHVGSIVEAIVQNQIPSGVVLTLQTKKSKNEKGVMAFAVQAQVDGADVAEGKEVEAIVLDIDLGKGIVDVSLKKQLIEANRGREKKTPSTGKRVDCVVELVKEDQVIVNLSRRKHIIAHTLSRSMNETELRSSVLRPGVTFKAKCLGVDKRGTVLVEIDSDATSNKSVKQPQFVQELTLGSQVTGQVTSAYPNQVNVKFGKAGVGRIHVTEAIDPPKDVAATMPIGSPLASLTVGRTVTAKVVSVRNEESHVVELSLRKDSPTENPNRLWEGLTQGSQVLGFVKSAKNSILWVSVTPTIAGRVRAIDSGRSVEELNSGTIFKEMSPGQSVVCYVLLTDKSRSRLDLSLVPVPDNVIGGVINVEVDRVQEGDGVRVQLPGHGLFGHRYGRICFTDLTDDFDEVRKIIERLEQGKYLHCKVLSTGSGEDNGRVNLTMRPSQLVGSDECTVVDREINSAQDLEVGQKVRGFVKLTTTKGCFIVLGASFVGRAKLSNLGDHFIKNVVDAFPPGKLVCARVMSINNDEGSVELSLRSNLEDGQVNGIPVSDLAAGSFVSGIVKSITEFGLFVRLGENVTGLCHKSQLSDKFLRDSKQKFSVGQRVRAKVLKVDIEKKRIALSMKPSELADDPGPEAAKLTDTSDAEDAEDAEMSDSEEDGSDAKMRDPDIEKMEEGEEGEEGEEEKEKDGEEVKAGLEISVGFNFEEEDGSGDISAVTVDEDGEYGQDDQEDDDAASDDNENETSKRKRSSKAKRAKKKAKEEMERELRRKEEALAASMDSPETPEDFERLLMGTPNSSMLWIRYIALRLSLSQLEKARETAERALNTIYYRDEREKMNVWVAYINMEAAFGDEKTVITIFDRASSNVDAKELHLRVLTALKDRKALAEVILARALKKFKSSKKIWIAAGTMKFETGDVEEARALLERSLRSLARHKHVAVISKFAQLEYKYGSKERGRTVFEGLIGNLPRRIDLWGIYIDMEIRALRTNETVDPEALRRVRSLFDRCCALDLSTKKMKYFFKRYLELEKEFGEDEDMQRVKDMARAYVESKMH